jgi:ribosomal protein S18 acetylase RimI-like enzyme
MPIRRAVAGDDNAIRELAQAFEVFGPYVDVFCRMLHGGDLSKHNVFFPVEIHVQEGDDGGILGFIAVEWVEPGDSKTGKIHGVSVRPYLRRGGVASTLLDHVVRLAMERGTQRLDALTAEVENPPARTFFERKGFVTNGVVVGRYQAGQTAITMVRTLNPH